MPGYASVTAAIDRLPPRRPVHSPLLRRPAAVSAAVAVRPPRACLARHGPERAAAKALRPPLIAAAVGILTLFALLAHGATLAAVYASTLAAVLLAIAASDAASQRIPLRLPLLGLGLAAAWRGHSGGEEAAATAVGVGAAAALVLALVASAVAASAGRRALGTADLFVAAMLGAALGGAGVVWVLGAGAAGGLVWDAVQQRRSGRAARVAAAAGCGLAAAVGAELAIGAAMLVALAAGGVRAGPRACATARTVPFGACLCLAALLPLLTPPHRHLAWAPVTRALLATADAPDR